MPAKILQGKSNLSSVLLVTPDALASFAKEIIIKKIIFCNFSGIFVMFLLISAKNILLPLTKNIIFTKKRKTEVNQKYVPGH